VRNVSYIFLPLLAFASAGVSAASPVLTVVQKPEYPAPGQDFSYPPGLLVQVCSDGAIYRALGFANVGKSAVSGRISGATLDHLRGNLASTWFAGARKKCTSGPTPFHVPTAVIEIASDTFECDIFPGSGATELLEKLVWSLPIEVPAPATIQPFKFCS
jgi:hypothetical protein